MSSYTKATYQRLSVLEEPTDAEQSQMVEEDDTWVWFVHQCRKRKGQVGRVGFASVYDNKGSAYSNCCSVVVPKALWHRWQAMSELERAVWSVRETSCAS
jgi:hypothetical protein